MFLFEIIFPNDASLELKMIFHWNWKFKKFNQIEKGFNLFLRYFFIWEHKIYRYSTNND